MAVFNGMPYLQETLDSLLCQNHDDFEIVIIDDASTDGSWDLITSIMQRNPKIRCFSNPSNLGLAGSLNRGLSECRAPLVARADADDVYAEDWLCSMTDFMKQNPTIGVVGSGVSFINETGAPVARDLNCFPLNHDEIEFFSLLGCSMWHATVVYKKDIVVAANGYDSSYARGPEDYHLWSRLLKRTKFANIRRPLVKVRLHQSSVTASWSRGFQMYCGISRILMSDWLGRSVTEEEATAAVTLSGWERRMERDSCLLGVRILQEIRTLSMNRVQKSIMHAFEKKIAQALRRQASISVYSDPKLSRILLFESLRWDSSGFLSVSSLVVCSKAFLPKRLILFLKSLFRHFHSGNTTIP
jgi:glycosyltransferase involved in cell wall biosynthesis